MTRLMRASTQPPKKPARTPRTVPMITATMADRKPTRSEIRAPWTMRAKMSRPLTGSTPSQCSPLMPPREPVGVPNSGSIRSSWNSLGSWP